MAYPGWGSGFFQLAQTQQQMQQTGGTIQTWATTSGTQNIHGIEVPYGTKLSMDSFRDYVKDTVGDTFYQGGRERPPTGSLLFRLRKETREFIGDRKLN